MTTMAAFNAGQFRLRDLRKKFNNVITMSNLIEQ